MISPGWRSNRENVRHRMSLWHCHISARSFLLKITMNSVASAMRRKEKEEVWQMRFCCRPQCGLSKTAGANEADYGISVGFALTDRDTHGWSEAPPPSGHGMLTLGNFMGNMVPMNWLQSCIWVLCVCKWYYFLHSLSTNSLKSHDVMACSCE